MKKTIWISAFMVSMFAVAAYGQSTIKCESQDGRYHECKYNGFGSVSLANQISGSNCIEGQTWGVRRNVIWVDNGCRANFAVYSTNNTVVAPATTTITCESQMRHRQTCSADTRFGVALSRQLSHDNCIQGKSWGYNNGSVWVDNGCRAEFVVGTTSYNLQGQINSSALPSYATTINCESNNNRRNYCAADPIGGVELSRKLSSRDCVQGRDWGYDSSGVWVTNGCRAEFRVGGEYGNLPQYSSYTTPVKCESVNGRRNYCRAMTQFGVQIGRQLSDASCVFNRDWGYDSAGIWVRNGCRAEFYTGR